MMIDNHATTDTYMRNAVWVAEAIRNTYAMPMHADDVFTITTITPQSEQDQVQARLAKEDLLKFI